MRNIINLSAADKAGVSLGETDDCFVVSIKKDYFRKTGHVELMNSITKTLFPAILEKNQAKESIQEIKTYSTEQQIKNPPVFPHIAYFIDHVGHYTGGRYSAFLHAMILSTITKVTVVSNERLLFQGNLLDVEDFTRKQLDLNFVVSEDFLNNKDSNDFGLVIGCPMVGGVCAKSYCDKHNIPLYLMLFESPNFIREYRTEEPDAQEEFWKSYKHCLLEAAGIIVPSRMSAEYLRKWDNGFENKKIFVIAPPINEFVARGVRESRVVRDNKRIILSTRMAPFKFNLGIIKELLARGYTISLIGKVWAESKKMLLKLADGGYSGNIELHETITDKEKYQLIKSAALLISTSRFEGFGMSPMEALYFGVPVLCYDLPVLHETYANEIDYANDDQEFIKKCVAIVENNKHPGNFPRCCLMQSVLDRLMGALNIPVVTTGTIVFEGDDYLQYAVQSVRNSRYHIIVEGAVKGYSDHFRSTDNTPKIIENLVTHDVVGKFIFVKKEDFFNDKVESQNLIVRNIPLSTKFYVKLDHDEIWGDSTLRDVVQYLFDNENIHLVRMPFLHFWTNFKTIATDAGGKWTTKHPRVWRWKSSYSHLKSFNFFVDSSRGNVPVSAQYHNEMVFDKPIFHFGYVRKLKIVQGKIAYYAKRGIERVVVDTYTNWHNNQEKTQPTQAVRSWSETFDGQLPNVLADHPYCNLNDVRK